MNKLSGTLLQVVLFILFVSLAAVDGWGECSYVARQQYLIGELKKDYEGCDESLDCSGYVPQQGFYVCSTQMEDQGCRFGSKCPNGWRECTYKYVYCTAYVTDNKCEADSLQCIKTGGTWTNTGAPTCNGYSCKRPCDSASVACTAKNGSLFAGVLQDTTVSDTGTTITNKCYYNCSHSPNTDSTVYLVEGNIVLSGPSESIQDGTKSEAFNSVRTTTGGVYVYDYLSPAASEYIDSIAAMKCVEHLWRCVINNKYVYWYDNQEVPAGCTNIVRVK